MAKPMIETTSTRQWSSQGQSILTEKSLQRRHEAAVHTVTTVRRQRGEKADAHTFSFPPVQDPSPWDGTIRTWHAQRVVELSDEEDNSKIAITEVSDAGHSWYEVRGPFSIGKMFHHLLLGTGQICSSNFSDRNKSLEKSHCPQLGEDPSPYRLSKVRISFTTLSGSSLPAAVIASFGDWNEPPLDCSLEKTFLSSESGRKCHSKTV